MDIKKAALLLKNATALLDVLQCLQDQRDAEDSANFEEIVSIDLETLLAQRDYDAAWKKYQEALQELADLA